MRDRIFKLSPIYASVIIRFGKFSEFNETSAPFRENSITTHLNLSNNVSLVYFSSCSRINYLDVTKVITGNTGMSSSLIIQKQCAQYHSHDATASNGFYSNK